MARARRQDRARPAGDGPSDPVLEAARQWDLGDVSAVFGMVSLHRAVKVIDENVSRVLEPYHLTFTRFTVLARLYWSAPQGVSMGEVAQFLWMHPTSITSAIDRLESDGLARRGDHPADRRATLATVTPAGIELLDELIPRLDEAGWGFERTSRRDLVAMAAILRRVRGSSGDHVGSSGAYAALLAPLATDPSTPLRRSAPQPADDAAVG